MQHCQDLNACFLGYKNMTIQSNTSDHTSGSLPEKSNTPIELCQNIQTLYFNSEHLNLFRGAIQRGPVHMTV